VHLGGNHGGASIELKGDCIGQGRDACRLQTERASQCSSLEMVAQTVSAPWGCLEGGMSWRRLPADESGIIFRGATPEFLQDSELSLGSLLYICCERTEARPRNAQP
jgi:hypothetical protein